jgi:hypothetical protein
MPAPSPWIAAGVLLGALLLTGCAAGPSGDPGASHTPLPSLRTATPVDRATDAPEGPLATAADREAAYGQLRASVPMTLAPRCTRAEPDEESAARVDCDLPATTGIASLTYRLYDGGAALDRAWKRLVSSLPDGAAKGPGCSAGSGVDRTGTGAVACWAEGGHAVTAWKNELAFVIARAERGDADRIALERFRVQAGPVTP